MIHIYLPRATVTFTQVLPIMFMSYLHCWVTGGYFEHRWHSTGKMTRDKKPRWHDARPSRAGLDHVPESAVKSCQLPAKHPRAEKANIQEEYSVKRRCAMNSRLNQQFKCWFTLISNMYCGYWMRQDRYWELEMRFESRVTRDRGV